MATPKYCNTTTDLTDSYAQIEEYASTRWPLKDFEVYSAGGSIYRTENAGRVEKLYEDGEALTSVSAIASVSAASKYYYDATNDILYVRASDSNDPDTHEMEKGFNWSVMKTRARDKAQDEVDGMLDARFPRPIPQARQYHATDYMYDIGLVKSCALLTCANILSSFGDFEAAAALRLQVNNPENENGLIDKYNKGSMRFSWEVTPDELGHYDIEAASANTGDGFIELYGKYGGSEDIDDPLVQWDLEDEVWLIEIDTAGATGTATFKWSRDNGTTFQATLQATSYEWIALGAGIKVRFWDRDGEFDDDDIWRAYMKIERREDIVQPSIIVLRG